MNFLQLFGIQSRALLRRALLRSLILGFLIAVAALTLNYLIDLARFHGSDIPDRYPEILIIFRAVAILTWFEVSIFWIRLATQPDIDTQETAKFASQSVGGAAAVYWASKFTWVVRMVLLMQLCDFWK